jgi:hypothetical protein
MNTLNRAKFTSGRAQRVGGNEAAKPLFYERHWIEHI